MRRSREPVLWAMFSGGGMLAALFLPALILMLWIAAPLGWIEGVSYGGFAELLRHPLTRIFLFVLIMLALFHWAHRLRYTLYDGLQLYHLEMLIAVITYGVATVVSLIAAYVLLVAL